jgi:hypothetical protein
VGLPSFTDVDAKQRQELANLGLLEQLPDGSDGVRVYLQYRPRLDPGSRAERREALHSAFEELTADKPHVMLDPKSLSVSGQSIEATVPLERFDEVERELADSGLGVNVVRDYQVV